MIQEVSSEAWEDLGSRTRDTGAKNPYQHLKAPRRFDYEPLSIIESRRSKNQSVLESLKTLAQSVEETPQKVSLKIHGKSFEFWPATDCWLSHAKGVYGTGIERLATLIHEKLVHEDPAS